MADRVTPPVLVLGVGNDLRGDDAAGCLVAAEVAGWDRPGVRVIVTQQLVPELAAAVATAATVVLIDATVCGSDTPSLVEVPVETAAGSLSHHASLSELLALARTIEDRAPRAWVLAIPAESFDLGAAPSPRCRHGIDAALKVLAGVLPGP